MSMVRFRATLLYLVPSMVEPEVQIWSSIVHLFSREIAMRSRELHMTEKWGKKMNIAT